MSKQAKTLNSTELKRVLNYIAAQTKHSARNRALLLITHYAGLRVAEAVSLRYSDVVADDGTIRTEIKLRAEQAKGGYARTVFVSERLRKELIAYIRLLQGCKPTDSFFYTQKRPSGFSPNSAAQFFHYLYKRAGVDGASSHSGRRSFITNLAEKGVAVRVIMGLSGHRQLSSVQAYMDCNPVQMRNAVELL